MTADSPLPAVKQTRMMTKSEKYLKLCEVLLVAVVLLVIVGVLLLPTVFYALLKMGCLKTPLQGCSSTGPGVWVFNNNPRVSKGCEVLKVGCLKTLTEVFQGCGCLILKLCGGHYLE